jgi:uncharacterized protein
VNFAILYRYQWLLIKLPIALSAGLSAIAIWYWIWPMPPSYLRISTASTDGAYYLHAQRYKEKFAANGVRLDILTSAGSLDNLGRLRASDPAADLAFLQGGFGYLGASVSSTDAGKVQTLANVDIEPVWIFSLDHDIESLDQLAGLRVAIGPEGSGSRIVAVRLLEQARMGRGSVRLSSLAGGQAAAALREKQVDVVIMVAGTDASVVKTLLGVPGIRLANLRKSAAITERNPYLETRLLAQGTLAPTVPPRDIAMLTTSASLVSRESLHPALKKLAVQIASQTHGGSGIFHRAGDFPSLRRIDFPTAPEARAALLRGPGLLERLLPFWWAQIAERLLLIVLPAGLLALWLMRLVPAVLRWSLQSRVNRWYGELKFIENDLSRSSPTGMDITRFVARLSEIDRAMMAFSAPKDLMTRCFTLHHHIEFVRMRLHDVRGR